jgi:AraC-like DNA-binding protein
MQRIERTLLLLHRDAALGELLTRLPGLPYRVRGVEGWETLREALRGSSPTTLVVVDPFEGAGPDGPAPELRRLLAEFPEATVVAAFRPDPSRAEALAALIDWGVAEWLDLEREDRPAAVLRRLRKVWSRPVERLLRRALPRGAPSRTRMLLSVAVEVVAAGGQAPEMAAALEVGERTVTRWFERADLPPPRRLFAWLRLLLAADLLDDPERSLESISRATGYAGAPSLKSALRNLLGTTPRELREAGAFRTVAARFAGELFELREQSRSSGKPARVWLH